MSKRPLKYQKYLSRYSNCPPSNCIEKDKICYRWVHKPETEKDFFPRNCHPDIAPRGFDSSEVDCMSYGLSLYATLEDARKFYNYQYGKRLRKIQKERFIQEKGEIIAELDIKKEDGIQGEPNKDQHFTFYQYEGCPFLKRVNARFDIFVKDEDAKNV
jgi:hypothetical protein